MLHQDSNMTTVWTVTVDELKITYDDRKLGRCVLNFKKAVTMYYDTLHWFYMTTFMFLLYEQRNNMYLKASWHILCSAMKNVWFC